MKMEMTTGTILGLLAIGLAAGFLSSLVGIGGGIVIVPALVLIFGLGQKEAQGTSLALLSMPVALVAAFNYHKAGQVNWKIALILAVTFVVGGFVGSKLVLGLDTGLVKKIFAIGMIAIAIKYLFFDK